MRYAPLLVMLLSSLAMAQTTRPATQPAADRSTPLGTFIVFDKTVADLGVDKAMAFYHCTTDKHREYARAECEYYVAVNLLVRAAEKRFGKAVAQDIRSRCGDSDDYTDAEVREEADAAAMLRPGQTPFPLIRIDGKWHFSMPDQFELQGAQTMASLVPYFKRTAVRIDEVRKDIESGVITDGQQARIAAGRVREQKPPELED